MTSAKTFIATSIAAVIAQFDLWYLLSNRTSIPLSVLCLVWLAAHSTTVVVGSSRCFLWYSELIDPQPYHHHHHYLQPYPMTSSVSFAICFQCHFQSPPRNEMSHFSGGYWESGSPCHNLIAPLRPLANSSYTTNSNARTMYCLARSIFIIGFILRVDNSLMTNLRTSKKFHIEDNFNTAVHSWSPRPLERNTSGYVAYMVNSFITSKH